MPSSLEDVLVATRGVPRAAVAHHGIGVRLAKAVAGVHAEIGTSPGPRCYDRRSKCARSLVRQGLVDRRRADAGQYVIAPDGGIELVVETDPHDVVGDAGIAGERDRRRVEWIGDGRRDGTEVHVEVLDLAGHVAEQATLEAGADRPASFLSQHADSVADRAGVAVGVETDAGKPHRAPDRADRQTAGGIGHDIGSDRRAETSAQGAERIQFVALVEGRRHRRVEVDDAGVADRAGAEIARRRTLARDLNVGFDTGDPIAPLPIVAALDAADRTVETVRGAGGQEGSAGGEVAEDSVGLGLAGAVADVGADIGTGPAPGGQNRRLEERRAEAGRRLVVAALVDRRHAAEFGVHEELDAAPRHQDFVLVELHGVAHIDVEQVVADQAGRDLGRAPR